MTEPVDVIVVGMGPGGEEVAASLAGEGLEVLGVEGKLVGGECPYWGCIPSKMMIRAAGALAEARRVRALAGSAEVHPDWSPVARRIRDEATADWNDDAAVRRFTDRGGRFQRGWGRLAGPHRVAVGERVFEARRGVVLNTGTEAAVPPVPGLADVPYWTNREAIETTEVPGSLVVLGGGAIGCELAQAFARFGARVTVVEAAPRLLPAEEPEAGALLASVFGAEGIDVRAGTGAARVEREGDGIAVDLAGGERIAAERLLVATGRRSRLADLGLESVGLDPAARFLTVDEHMRAGEGLWAVGDITGKGAFTHVSMYQAKIAVDDILGRGTLAADYRALPRVTFTDPEIGSVGMSETAARAAGIDVRTGTMAVPDSTRGWIHAAGNEGLIKLVADGAGGTLVGATFMGPAGGEALSMLTLAVHARIPVATLRRMIYPFPTFHRGVEAALGDFGDG